MKRKQEKRYLEKEWQTMRSHLRSFLKKGKQEHLHCFRVQVKKLHALVVMADSIQEKPVLAPHFKPVRKVFKKAGEIRDVFINLKMAKIFGLKDAQVLTTWHQQLQYTGKAFRKSGKQYLQGIEKARIKMKVAVMDIPDIHINLYYQTQLEQITVTLAENTFDDRLHTCRKQLKILIYTYPLVAKILDLGFNETYLEDMQAAIGDWHDNQTTIYLLKNEDVNKTIMNQLNKETDELKKRVTALSKDFYNRATMTTELT